MTFTDINSWADFEGALEPLGKKAKGDAFEELTYWFVSKWLARGH